MEIKKESISPTYFPMGEQAIVIQFDKVISIETSKRVYMLGHLIESKSIIGITQLIPAFNNLTVCYNPLMINYDHLLVELQTIKIESVIEDNSQSTILYVPVTFGGEHGPDLEVLSDKAKLKPEEVINTLQARAFYVYMIGFIAGFPYCGDIDERLVLPRRTNPRSVVKKGSIIVANQLTGIYSMTAPSGWHIVGWTPMEIFNPSTNPPSLIQAGNYIQYVPIKKVEAEQWSTTKQSDWDEKWNIGLK